MDTQIQDVDFLEVFTEKPVDAGTALIFIDLTVDGVAHDLDLKIDPNNLLKIDLQVLNLSESRVIPFSSVQAGRIADFVKEHEKDSDTLICLDSAGKTYSAGVAAAIREYCTHDGIEIFINPAYKPEVGAFHMVLEALTEELLSKEEDDASDQLGKNLEVQLHNESSIQELAAVPFKKKAALISVCDDDCEGELDLKNSPEYFFEINMDEVYINDSSYDEDDEDEEEEDEGFCVTPAFDYGQAERIADFVNQHKDEVDVLICQGFEDTTEDYSRAIAAAISEFYNHDGIEIFKAYHLHTGVFQMMYAALTGDFFDDFVYLLK